MRRPYRVHGLDFSPLAPWPICPRRLACRRGRLAFRRLTLYGKRVIFVCFVCLGNICRSPTAEGIFRHLVEHAGLEDKIAVSSAATAGYHVGDPADVRSRRTARTQGIELRGRARRFEATDFERFDYVVAMDRNNLADLERLARTHPHRSKLSLLRSHEPGATELDVPDPYYGGSDAFERVFAICEWGCRGLLATIRRTHGF